MAYLRSKYIPNASYPGTLGDVTLTGTQTLTNKTFVAPALGTPASGAIPATFLTGDRTLQTHSGYKAPGSPQVNSGSNTLTMAGAPMVVYTDTFDTLDTASSYWKVEGYCGFNNEGGGIANNLAMRFWVSYNNRSTWTHVNGGVANFGNYMNYDMVVDTYGVIHGQIITTATASQGSTVFGAAFFSHESDPNRFNFDTGSGCCITAIQFVP